MFWISISASRRQNRYISIFEVEANASFSTWNLSIYPDPTIEYFNFESEFCRSESHFIWVRIVSLAVKLIQCAAPKESRRRSNFSQIAFLITDRPKRIARMLHGEYLSYSSGAKIFFSTKCKRNVSLVLSAHCSVSIFKLTRTLEWSDEEDFFKKAILKLYRIFRFA